MASRTPDLALAEARKADGTRLFKLEDFGAADAAYTDALGAVPAGALMWPKAEKLVYSLRANRAICNLKLAQPDVAIEQCELGLELPGVILDDVTCVDQPFVREWRQRQLFGQIVVGQRATND